MYTSRSAIEAYQKCPRYRYNQYFLGGKGVVPVQKSIPLTTGSALHEGIGHLLARVKLGIDVLENYDSEVDAAVGLAVNNYVNEVEKSGFYGRGVKTDRQTEYTLQEQKALTEALIRTWAIVELPNLVERFKVVGVEREVNLPLVVVEGGSVTFMARVDAELFDKKDESYFNYSLKSCKEWNERMEKSYKSDLQGITEVWAVEEDARIQTELIDSAIVGLDVVEERVNSPVQVDNVKKIRQFLQKFTGLKRVMGVRFCFLVKGNRVPEGGWKNKDNNEALWVTYSPLIRGYKRFTPNSVEYAHSWFYPNPENKSGKSILGKGWEPFNVWESYEGGIKRWVERLALTHLGIEPENQIQPECGDVLAQQVIVPIEYFRDQPEMEEGIREIIEQETTIERSIFHEAEYLGQFPHYRRSCYWPEYCEYIELCWKPEVGADPIGSELYQIRVPHHRLEREKGE